MSKTDVTSRACERLPKRLVRRWQRRLALPARFACAGLLSVAAITGVGAQPATRPVTQLATRPVTMPAHSLETPRDALKWFAAALRDGDLSRLRDVVVTASDADDRMVASMAEMASALSALHASAVQAYGAEAAVRFTDDASAGYEQTLARIDSADVSVEGDVATVRYAEEKDRTYQLRKIKSVWRVPASQFALGAADDVVARRAAELSGQAKIVTEVSKEIAAGKYRNADAAGQAWRSKMMAALGMPIPPAPATKPAK